MNILKDYIRFVISEQVDRKSSLMIALYPNEKSLDQFIQYRKKYIRAPKDSKILKKNEIHCTLRYWDNHKNKIDSIVEMLENLNLKGLIEAYPDNIKKLGSSVSLMLDSPSAQKTYKRINKELLKLGLPDSEYPEYLPHLAFFYSEDIEDKNIPDKSYENKIIFDRICLVDQDDTIFLEIKL